MLVLFETPAGYAIFKLMDEGKLAKSDNLYEDFETLDKCEVYSYETRLKFVLNSSH